MNNSRLIRILLLLGLLAGITLAVVYRDRFDAVALEAWINDAGVLAPIVFMLIYALATVLFLPGSVITLAGGALFGPVLGTFYNLTGATLGAVLAFLISRYLASDWIADKTGGKYFRAHDTAELKKIYQLLNELEPVEVETKSFRPVTSLFYWPLTAAILIAALLSLLRISGIAK